MVASSLSCGNVWVGVLANVRFQLFQLSPPLLRTARRLLSCGTPRFLEALSSVVSDG